MGSIYNGFSEGAEAGAGDLASGTSVVNRLIQQSSNWKAMATVGTQHRAVALRSSCVLASFSQADSARQQVSLACL